MWQFSCNQVSSIVLLIRFSSRPSISCPPVVLHYRDFSTLKHASELFSLLVFLIWACDKPLMCLIWLCWHHRKPCTSKTRTTSCRGPCVPRKGNQVSNSFWWYRKYTQNCLKDFYSSCIFCWQQYFSVSLVKDVQTHDLEFMGCKQCKSKVKGKKNWGVPLSISLI